VSFFLLPRPPVAFGIAWAPVYYRVPDESLVAACIDLLKHPRTCAQLPENLIALYRVEEVSEEAFEK
jgi:hypothetical protein